MEQTRDTIIILAGKDPYNAINGLLAPMADMCQSHGLKVEIFDLAKFDGTESSRFFNLISSSSVKFALTYLGIGQDLKVDTKSSGQKNLWEFFNIPLLKIHGDSSAYFLDRHKDTPSNGINIETCIEFLEFHRLVMPNSSCLSTVCDPWIISNTNIETIDFNARKKGRLFFIKNGGDPDELTRLWKAQLPPELNQQLLDLADEVNATCLHSPKTNIHDVVSRHLASRHIDLRQDGGLLCFYVAQMDDYLRRIKSTLIAKALLSCPVVIQGNKWDHLDTTGARATLRPAQDFEATESLFQTELGIIDMGPNVDSCGHDRLFRAAGTYAFGLSNRSAWLESLLPELNEAAFTFHPEAIQESVYAALRDPARCVELGRQFGAVFRARYHSQDFVDRLCTVAEMSRLRHANPKPPMQPYLVW